MPSSVERSTSAAPGRSFHLRTTWTGTVMLMEPPSRRRRTRKRTMRRGDLSLTGIFVGALGLDSARARAVIGRLRGPGAARVARRNCGGGAEGGGSYHFPLYRTLSEAAPPPTTPTLSDSVGLCAICASRILSDLVGSGESRPCSPNGSSLAPHHPPHPPPLEAGGAYGPTIPSRTLPPPGPHAPPHPRSLDDPEPRPRPAT